ncbi:MAG: type II toxin-antitoxin system Phd/YefM family antitoxin [Treponema sp.]|nr:type II toxin-antitoxin system Phd/YefM family antitoxin [Treponema sp.]
MSVKATRKKRQKQGYSDEIQAFLGKPEKTEWQLQEAKAMFSEVIRLSHDEPQIITVHGKRTAVILSFEEYEKLSTPKQSIYDFFQNSPFRDVVLELPPREIEPPRDLNL